MKKIKSFTAFLLALILLAPSVALVSCKEENIAQLPPPQSESSAESSTGNTGEQEQTPPTQTPQTPSTGNGSSSSGSSSGSGNSNGSSGSSGTENAPTVQPTVSKAQYLKCSGDSVNLRSGAGTSYAVLGQAKAGESYAIVGQTGNWYKTYYRGKVAYIYASYAAVFSLEKSKNEDVEAVIAEGYKLIGVPYVYGAVRLHDGKGKLLKGFTAQKFDCSSLMQYIFYKGADTLIDVNTRTQVKQGKYVAKSDLQRGDCIFFTNESRDHLTGVERIGHVALYLGNNYILHTASDYARIEKISTTRWSYYVEARRFL